MTVPAVTGLPLAAPPAVQDVASQLLATMQAESGVLTDYNIGSQIRTLAEAIGGVASQQGMWATALALQATVYGAMALYGITPRPAAASNGSVSFQTSSGAGGPLIAQNVAIPSGTIVQTTGGIQFATTAAVTLASGASGVSAAVQALVPGIGGNVPAGAITQISTGLLYPLYAANALPTSGGLGAEQPSQTVARFAAAVAAVPRASPVAVANAAVGVVYSGTGETVRYATCYEPWIAAGSGPGSGTAGFTVYVDNGFGAASSGLTTAVSAVLNGDPSVSGALGYRPAGVPYGVSAVSPTLAVVGVTGSVGALATTGQVSGLILAAVSGYFGYGDTGGLAFGAPAQQAVLAQSVGNAVLGLMATLSVTLAPSGGAAASGVSVAPSGRVTLGLIGLSLS